MDLLRDDYSRQRKIRSQGPDYVKKSFRMNYWGDVNYVSTGALLK